MVAYRLGLDSVCVAGAVFLVVFDTLFNIFWTSRTTLVRDAFLTLISAVSCSRTTAGAGRSALPQHARRAALAALQRLGGTASRARIPRPGPVDRERRRAGRIPGRRRLRLPGFVRRALGPRGQRCCSGTSEARKAGL